MALGHLALNVTDLAAARAHYDVVMPELGYEPFLVHDDEFAYRPAAGKHGTYLFFYAASTPAPFDRAAPGLQHLAFMVPTRTQVERVHDVVAGLGCEIVHPPRHWPQYPPPYYATFWLDPHGFLLEAVCHHDRA
jgi:catechol 2,3-dioxygenase-like lactoylglutathione lyase family enzyme